MSATLESMEARLAKLEAEMAAVKQAQAASTIFGPVPPARQAALSRMFREALREMGMDIEGRPFVPPDELKQRMMEHGVRPGERIITRGIRELRGESEVDW